MPGERHAADVGAGLDEASRNRLLEAGELGTYAAFLPLVAAVATKVPKLAGGIGAITLDQLLGEHGVAWLRKQLSGE